MTGPVYCEPGCTCGRHNRKAAGGEATVKHRLNAQAESVTVSYRRTSDDVYAVTVGRGASVAERIANADDQLPPGEWLRLCVSTPVTIYTDLVGRVPRGSFKQGPSAALSYPNHELRTVDVA